MRAVFLLAAAVLAAGCGGADETGPDDRVAGTTAAAVDTRPAPAEVRWVGRGLDWVRGLQRESEELMREVDALDRGRTDDVGPSLAAIGAIDERCTEPELDRPVTRRLASLHEKLLHVCYEIGGAVESLRIALDPPEYSPPNSAQTRADIREFVTHWKRGFQLARAAGREAAAYAPTNARPLPERDRGDGSHVAPKLGRAAATLAGEEAVVQCWSKADWARVLEETARFLNEPFDEGTAGFVVFGDHRINLPPDVCATLERGGGDAEARAFAVATLAHEARHVAGTVNETTATCQSIEDLPKAARLLGLGQAAGRDLAALFRERIRPTLPPAYRSFDC